jgi:hypothetical protein
MLVCWQLAIDLGCAERGGEGVGDSGVDGQTDLASYIWFRHRNQDFGLDRVRKTGIELIDQNGDVSMTLHLF